MINLRPVDAVEVFSLVDNALEIMYHIDRDDVQRPGQWNKDSIRTLPVAEHGYAALLRTHTGDTTHTVLIDTGARPDIAVENAHRLAFDLHEVESVVISHSHWDHYGGLLSVLDAVDRDNVPLFVHPNMFKTFGYRDKAGKIHEEEHAAIPIEADIRAAGGLPTDSAAPTLIAGDTVLITGEIPRLTAYETGYPGRLIYVDGAWLPYDDMRDERALVVNVAGHGLAVLTGCGHAGAVNTVRCAQALTGIDRLHMLMGGFHLAGKRIESRIPQTVQDIAALEPALLVPCHCTGFPAAVAFAQAMPGAFVANSVGNRYVVGQIGG